MANPTYLICYSNLSDAFFKCWTCHKSLFCIGQLGKHGYDSIFLRVTITIYVHTFKIRLLEADSNPLFDMIFDPKFYSISKLFPNSDTRSSYLLKFDANPVIWVIPVLG